MEFKQVVGRVRDHHFFLPWKPVERAKIQKVLEAARLASRGMNVAFAKAIVVYRDELSQEQRDALKTPMATVEFDLAPVYILWYHDMDAGPADFAQRRWPSVPSGAIFEAGALPPLLGWSERYANEVIIPEALGPVWSRGRAPGGHADTGVAIGQALLCAVDEGLATCLTPFNEEAARDLLGVPEGWEPLLALLLGYAAEEWEGMGQLPGEPDEVTAFECDLNTPFRWDERLRERLQEEGMLHPRDPAPWRPDEIRFLARMVERPTNGAGWREGMAVVGKTITNYETVRVWLASYAQFWGEEVDQESLQALAHFCERTGQDPDSIIGECLQPSASGEGRTLKVRARRKYIEAINQFEAETGSRDAANAVRSFLIHNGVLVSPSILR